MPRLALGSNLIMNKKTRIVLSIILVFILLICIGIMSYPYISTKYAESVQSKVHTQYKEVLQGTSDEEIDAIWAAAQDYNQRFYSGQIDLFDPGAYGYFEQLRIPSSDVMGYIRIPRLNVELPIYHGIGSDALNRGCGHMPQSSLPIGGENTHAVISAHTGMAEAPMFSELERMLPGDIFQIEILGRLLTYQVEEDGIQTVLPQDISSIQIARGSDLVTLVTCTPFGINSHRLLVRGTRIPNPETADIVSTTEITDADSSVWSQQYTRSISIGLGIAGLFVILIVAIMAFRRIREKRGNRDA